MTSKSWQWLWLIPAVAFAVYVFDGLCYHDSYALADATVIKVLPNPKWGFIGVDHMTVVKFTDGMVINVGGYKGEPGDRIKVHRSVGSETPLGLWPKRKP